MKKTRITWQIFFSKINILSKPHQHDTNRSKYYPRMLKSFERVEYLPPHPHKSMKRRVKDFMMHFVVYI